MPCLGWTVKCYDCLRAWFNPRSISHAPWSKNKLDIHEYYYERFMPSVADSAHLVRMINWKVGEQRPSTADAERVVIGDATASVILVFEMEMPKDAEHSAAALACQGAAPYEMLVETREPHKKYLITMSLLVRKDFASEIHAVGEPQVVCRSPPRSHKVCHAQAVRFGSSKDAAVIFIAGCNMDPHDKEFHAQLDQMDNWLNGRMTKSDGVFIVGDFNCRLRRPPWADTLEVVEKGKTKQVLTDEAVSEICRMMAEPEGRRQLAQWDCIRHTASGGSKQSQRLRDMLTFDPLSEVADPGFPTYKRTTGVVPSSDAAVLRQAFYGTDPEKEEAQYGPQRYVTGQLGGGIEELQLGWLERAAWRLSPTSQVDVQLVRHHGMDDPALSDHSATATEFSVQRRR